MVMGAPTLWGTFAFGDDHQLVLNHVLVNRPSVAHALELFRIIHRDLYQPLPLLSFQLEFAVAGALGLRERGAEGMAWLFHLNNVLLHAVNALLVWMLVRRTAGALGLARGEVIALAAGVLFAVHPLQVEVVAWINGRMMLLSTMFALLSLTTLSGWLTRGGGWRAAAVVLAALCCQVSKVRVEFPLLMLLILLAHRGRMSLRFAGLWAWVAAITAAAVTVNYWATEQAGMFEGAALRLTGPTTVRALRSLAWYVEHFVVPVGLAPWYPAPGVVRWMEWETLRAGLILLPAAGLGAWSLLRHRAACGGLAWFLLAIAATVQLVPTRNTLAADRYMYLPIVGLVWVMGLLAGYVADRTRSGSGAALSGTMRGAGGLAAAALLGISWHTGWFYNDPLRKIMRIAELYPTAAHVWERAAWAYYHDGQYEKAIALARREFEQDYRDAHADAWEVIGAAELKLGRSEAAMAALRRAMEVDPDKAGSYYRAGTVLEEMGRREEAVGLYEKAVGMAPRKNPWIVRLAGVYRELGRVEDARRMFLQALANNPYDIPSTLGLAELDIAEQTAAGCARAEERLRALLQWEPKHIAARIRLGVALGAGGRTEEAAAVYESVLRDDPGHATALLNLAGLRAGEGNAIEARSLYLRAAEEPLAFSEMLAIHDFLMATRDVETLVVFWSRQRARRETTEVREMELFSQVAAGRVEGVSAELAAIRSRGRVPGAMSRAVLVLGALATGEPEKAWVEAEGLLDDSAAAQAARRRLLAALEMYDERNAGNPWVYGVTAQLLRADGQTEEAKGFAQLARLLCGSEACRAMVAALEGAGSDGSNSSRGERKKE